MLVLAEAKASAHNSQKTPTHTILIQTVASNLKKTSEHIKTIDKKISELKSLDKKFSVFGSNDHKYKFNLKISENEVIKFENKHRIILPDSYREFILKFGNGGCGPDYGLLKIETGILDIPHYPEESDIIKLSNVFRFDNFWNLENFPDDDYQLWEKEYEDSKWSDGMLRICHQGCGVFLNLVITGKERGNIWVDDRVSDGGIYPVNHHKGKSKTDFTEWYLNWLNESIEKTTGNNVYKK